MKCYRTWRTPSGAKGGLSSTRASGGSGAGHMSRLIIACNPLVVHPGTGNFSGSVSSSTRDCMGFCGFMSHFSPPSPSPLQNFQVPISCVPFCSSFLTTLRNPSAEPVWVKLSPSRHLRNPTACDFFLFALPTHSYSSTPSLGELLLTPGQACSQSHHLSIRIFTIIALLIDLCGYQLKVLLG